MDVETVDALDRLSTRMDRLETSIDRLDVSLRGEMAQMRDDLRNEFGVGLSEIRSEVGVGLSENRRHAAMLFETLRDDIRLVAEGVAHLSVKIDQLPR